MDPQANGSETRNSTAVAIQLAVVMMAPELSATVRVVALLLVDSAPGWRRPRACRRPGALNALATSTATARPNGSGPDTLPRLSTAEAT